MEIGTKLGHYEIIDRVLATRLKPDASLHGSRRPSRISAR